jgi:DNA-binding transcriptional LysR family regulator
MPSLDVNRLRETEVFVRVVGLGGFSTTARALRMTPSAVSKLIARLEDRLGTRLITRSTRKLQLTPEGAAFYERAVPHPRRYGRGRARGRRRRDAARAAAGEHQCGLRHALPVAAHA